jgi:hypothetical protein
MKKQILLILYSLGLAIAFLLGNLFFVHPGVHAQENPQALKQTTYTFHLISHSGTRQLLTGSTRVLAKIPNADSNCLGIAMTINPGQNSVQVIMGVSNLCGLDVITVRWEYTSTAICNGQAYAGPSNSGGIARIANGVFVNVSNDYWASNCIHDGKLVPHTLSFTGTADGVFPPPFHGTASGRLDVPPVTIP